MDSDKQDDAAMADVQPGANYNKVGLTPHNGQSQLYYIPADATLALDQSISPQWSSPHTFLGNINFGAAASASLGFDGASLNYTIGPGVHTFHIDGKAVGVIDDPSSPKGSESLVSKAYVDGKVVPANFTNDIAISDLPLGYDDQPATTGRSHGSLAIGRNASATADGGVALGDCASVSTAAGIAIGNLATSTGANSIALGNGSDDGGQSNVLSVGDEGNDDPILRRIVNVAYGRDDTDAATVGQIAGVKYLAASETSGWGAPSVAGSGSVALGAGSTDQGQDQVLSIGTTLEHSPVFQRRIINVADGKAGNEAATFGQLQRYTAPRLTAYFDGDFVGMADGVGEDGQISALENWPITGEAILRSDTEGYDVVRVARLAKQACKHALTFYLYLNFNKIGSIAFEAGQSTGSIAFDENTDKNIIGGYWPLKAGDLLSLTRPHPAVLPDETAQGLLVAINASTIWNATPSGN